MKTSKRLLSILLMLTMLVSMFTVMASASAEEETQKINITFEIEGTGGRIELRKGKALLRSISSTLTWEIEPSAVEGCTVVAVANEGYTGKLYYANEEAGTSMGIGVLSKDVTFKAVFTENETEEPKPDPEPDPKPVESEKVYKLTVTINTNGVEKADVKFDADSILGYSGKTFEIDEASYKKGVTFNASADGEYEVSWTLNGTKTTGSSLKLAGLKEDAVNTLNVEFKAKEAPKPPVEKKYTLTITADPAKGGAVYYGDKKYTTMEGLEKGDERVLTAKAADGYEFVKWVVSGATISKERNETTTVTMGEKNATIKAVFEKTTTKGLKLSVSVSGTRHGDLWFYNETKDKWQPYDDRSWTLEAGEKVEFYADADSGYKAVWKLGNNAKVTDDEYTVTYKKMDGKSRTLYVEFVEKDSTSSYDTYSLTIDITGTKHGTVTRNGRTFYDGDVISIKKNDTRTFTAKADKGYVAVWTFKGETYVGKEFTVKMGAKDATLYVEFMDEDDYRLTKLPFRDVSEKDWYYDDVVFVYRNGYMDGMSSTKFGGNLNTTRGQIVTILWRLTGEPRAAKRNQFNDVSSSKYYYNAISWAAEAGIVDGFDARTFKPDENVTREQLAAILYRYAEYMNLSTRGASNLTKFDDYNKIGTWAKDAMAWANYHGLINGVSYSRIDPKGYATRAQIAAILHRFAVEFG